MVIYEGQIMGEIQEDEMEKIGLMMTGTPLTQIEEQGTAEYV
jgi:hypothetical protein